MRKILGFLLALCALPAIAQTSAVTATITDSPDGTAWATLNGFNATYSIQLVSSTGALVQQGQAVQIDTGATVQVTSQGTMDASGTFSATVASSNNIRPTGTKWQFKVCPAVTSAQCNTVTLPINASGTYSSQLSAGAPSPRIGGGIGNYAYTDAEVAAIPNNSYLNITGVAALRCYTISWGGCGGSGSGATLGANTFTGIQQAPGFAGTAGTQTILNETQGTAAAAPPVNTIQRGAPLSVPSSYDIYDPSAAPPDSGGDIALTPQGGGTATWMLPPTEALIARQTLATGTTSVTFSGIPQNYKTLVLMIASGNTSNAAAWAQLNFNGDVTAGHYFLAFSNVSFTPTAATGGGFTNPGIWVPVNASTTWLHGYSLSAGINSYSIGVVGGALEGLATAAGVWTPATPATSMVITTSTGNSFTAGSIFTLYGVY